MKQYTLFQKVHGKRADAEGAWLAYRVLIGHLKTATVKYHRGLKFDEEAGLRLTPHCWRIRVHS